MNDFHIQHFKICETEVTHPVLKSSFVVVAATSPGFLDTGLLSGSPGFWSAIDASIK